MTHPLDLVGVTPEGAKDREIARLRAELAREKAARLRAEAVAEHATKLCRRGESVVLDSAYSADVKLMEALRLFRAGGYGTDIIVISEFARALGKSERTAQRVRAHAEALGLIAVQPIGGHASAYRPGSVKPQRWKRKAPRPGGTRARYAARHAAVLAREAIRARFRGPQCTHAPEPDSVEPYGPAWGPPQERRPLTLPDRRKARKRPVHAVTRGGVTKDVTPPLYIDAREKYPPSVGTDRQHPPTENAPPPNPEPLNIGRPPAAGPKPGRYASDPVVLAAFQRLQELQAARERTEHDSAAQSTGSPTPTDDPERP